MSVIAAADLNATMDDLVTAYQKAVGTSGAGYGIGEPGDAYGVAQALTDVETDLAAAGTDALIDLGPACQSMMATFSASVIFGTRVRAFLARLDRHIRERDGVNATSLDSYLTYLNTGGGGTWAALQHFDLRTVWNKAKGGANYPKAYHLYFPVLQGVTYTNALGKFVVSGAGAGAFTNGVAVNSSAYAGGFGKLLVSGLAGSGNVTVTGVGFNPATKAVTASVTWITSISGDGLTTIVVGGGTAPANCLLIDVTNITIAAGITAGTIYVEAHKPTGRL